MMSYALHGVFFVYTLFREKVFLSSEAGASLSARIRRGRNIMPFKFEPVRGSHDAKMKARGEDPLVVVSGDEEL